MDTKTADKAKIYSSRKYFLSIIGTFYSLVVLLVFQASGFSRMLAGFLYETVPHYLVAAPYILVVFVVYYILDFPLNLYQSFILEHRFSLTKQKFSAWISDQLKSGLISYFIGLILLLAFYYIFNHSGRSWWWIISLFWVFFSIAFARIFPLIIIPLFFKYSPYSDVAIKERIMRLAEKMQVKILDIFQIDFSKKTLKANAAFVGLGSTKRVLLADTLKDKYSADEIEVILAHEFAHYKLKHLFKLLLLNAGTTMLIFYFIFRTSNVVLGWFSLGNLSDVAALPIVMVYFILFGVIMQPIHNFISRRFEKEADIMAIKTTGLKDAFISTMDKLGTQNLADRRPHPAIKLFFFDHPPIDERINLAKKL